MARPPDLERRRQLLDALIDAFADGGIGDRSLREVADAVGTSHRMLLHHFGSRDELLLAIVEEVERRQMAMLPDLSTDPPTGSPPCGPTFAGPSFARSSGSSSSATPAGHRASSRSPACSRAPSTSWLTEVDAKTGRIDDPAMVRLGLAVTRGLLLDLVATDDEAGVDAAAQAFVELLRRAGVPS